MTIIINDNSNIHDNNNNKHNNNNDSNNNRSNDNSIKCLNTNEPNQRKSRLQVITPQRRLSAPHRLPSAAKAERAQRAQRAQGNLSEGVGGGVG